MIPHFKLVNAFVERSASSDGGPVFLLQARGVPRNEDLSCVGVSSQPNDDLGVTDRSSDSKMIVAFKFKLIN